MVDTRMPWDDLAPVPESTEVADIPKPVYVPLEDQIWETDAGNGCRFARQHGADVRWCEPLGGWHVWDGKRWKLDHSGETMYRAKQTAKVLRIEAARCGDEKKANRLWRWAQTSENDTRLNAMLKQARSEPGINATPEMFDADAWVLNCENGLLDLHTGELKPHDRLTLCSKLAPVVFDPAAQAPRWMRFMDEITLGDEALEAYLQRKAGQCLTGDTTERNFALFYGIGHNGKSTFCHTLEEILGDYACSARIETFLQERRSASNASGDRARLVGARMVIASEIPQSRDLDETFIKDITGHTDTIVARHLYAKEFMFRPIFKLILFGNHKPRIKGTDAGIWGRVHLVPFLAKFEGQDADLHLDETLHGELSGILNWMLAGCLDWQAHGMQTPTAVAKATNDYKQEEDYIGQFIADRCILGMTLKVMKKALRDAYVAWCVEEGVQFVNQKEFACSMSERGFDGNARLGRNNARAWAGIGLQMPMDETPDNELLPMEKPLSKSVSEDLSPTAQALLMVLSDGTPRTARSLAMSKSLTDNEVRAALEELKAAGVAVEVSGGWKRGGENE